VAGSKPPLDVVYPYGNRFKRIAAIGVILLRIPTKEKHVARGETRLTTQQAGSKSGAPASANRHVGGLIIRRQVLAREHGGPPSLGPVCQISVPSFVTRKDRSWHTASFRSDTAVQSLLQQGGPSQYSRHVRSWRKRECDR
jgi:hypothetical protein